MGCDEVDVVRLVRPWGEKWPMQLIIRHEIFAFVKGSLALAIFMNYSGNYS
jgi:hypothetical protein